MEVRGQNVSGCITAREASSVMPLVSRSAVVNTLLSGVKVSASTGRHALR